MISSGKSGRVTD